MPMTSAVATRYLSLVYFLITMFAELTVAYGNFYRTPIINNQEKTYKICIVSGFPLIVSDYIIILPYICGEKRNGVRPSLERMDCIRGLHWPPTGYPAHFALYHP